MIRPGSIHSQSQHPQGKAEASGSKFEANLVYRMRSRTVGATQRNTILKNQKEKKKKKMWFQMVSLYLTVKNLHGQNYGTGHVMKTRFHYLVLCGFQWLKYAHSQGLCGYRVGVG